MNKQVVEIVTQKLQESLNAGIVPWQKTWSDWPCNLHGRKYTGINPILLNMSSIANDFSSSYWGTWKQIESLGGSVIPEQSKKYTVVVFWKVLIDKDEKGNEKKIFMLRYYKVYNLDQTTGINKNTRIAEIKSIKDYSASDSLISSYIQRTGVSYKEGGDSAHYSPSLDSIQMPLDTAFQSIDSAKWKENKTQVTFHEIAHSTGHSTRLNRKEVMDRISFGSNDYSHEELVAEIASCFLCSATSIEPNYINSASYIDNWKKSLKDNADWFITASSKAQKVMDFVIGEDNNNEEDEE